MTTRVELFGARIPVIGWIAHHHWLVVRAGDRVDRWEVWQSANAGGESFGHLHHGLFPPEAGVGWGPGWLVETWIGDEAEALAVYIDRMPLEYPWRGRYRYWPGPNSNTFVQWVLGPRRALGWQAIGRAYGARTADESP